MLRLTESLLPSDSPMVSDYDLYSCDDVTDAVVAAAAYDDGVANDAAAVAAVAAVAPVGHGQEPSWGERDRFDLA